MKQDNDRELEVKLYLQNPEIFKAGLTTCGAELEQPRVHEWNLRFDSARHNLSKNGKVLRLRKDIRTRLTFKSESAEKTEVSDRQELEVEVSDFESMQSILEALGFSVYVMYEKFRTTWKWMGCEVTLDEMPYGAFCEVEGPDAQTIMNVVQALGLKWENRILISYLYIFDLLKLNGETKARHLVFSGFKNHGITLSDFHHIGINPAD